MPRLHQLIASCLPTGRKIMLAWVPMPQPNAAKSIENIKTVLAIELISAAQAMHFRRPAKTSSILEKLLAEFEKQVPFIAHDRV